MVGFVQGIPSKTGSAGTMTSHPVQCFHAVQEKGYDVEQTEEFNNGKIKYNKITAHHNIDKEAI